MPYLWKVVIAGSVFIALGGGAWMMRKIKIGSDSSKPTMPKGSGSSRRSTMNSPVGGTPSGETSRPNYDFWRKVVERSASAELISAMNARYPNGQTVSLEQVFSYAESGGLLGRACTDAINAVVAAANGKLEIVTVREGDRWDNRTMQSEDNEVPPAAYVTEVLSAGLKMVQDGRIIVKAMVKLASKTDTGVL